MLKVKLNTPLQNMYLQACYTASKKYVNKLCTVLQAFRIYVYINALIYFI